MTNGSVSVAWPSIRRSLEANSYAGVYLLAVLDGVTGCPPEVLADVEAALDEANADMEDEEGQEAVWAAPPIPTPAGPVVNLDWVGEDDDTLQWLNRFAEGLVARGRRGTVKNAPAKHLPLSYEYLMRPQPVAFLAYELVDPLAPLSNLAWRVPDDTTREILSDISSWAEISNAQTFFHEEAFRMRVDPSDVRRLLEAAVTRSRVLGVTHVARKPIRARNVGLAPNGQVVLNDNDEHNRWEEHLPSLRKALLQNASRLDLGLIRTTTYGYSTSWMDLANSPVPRPHIPTEADWDSNRHMWARFVPDAHAIQVLTKAHLDKASDLSAWHITEVRGDRYLVEAPEVDAWFADGGTPTEELLLKARADFGEMIITRAAIQADPLGYVGGTPPPERA